MGLFFNLALGVDFVSQLWTKSEFFLAFDLGHFKYYPTELILFVPSAHLLALIFELRRLLFSSGDAFLSGNYIELLPVNKPRLDLQTSVFIWPFYVRLIFCVITA